MSRFQTPQKALEDRYWNFQNGLQLFQKRPTEPGYYYYLGPYELDLIFKAKKCVGPPPSDVLSDYDLFLTMVGVYNGVDEDPATLVGSRLWQEERVHVYFLGQTTPRLLQLLPGSAWWSNPLPLPWHPAVLSAAASLMESSAATRNHPFALTHAALVLAYTTNLFAGEAENEEEK